MSVKYLSAVWSDEKITCQGTLLVALAIADYANDKGYCWPATSSLAFKARCSERTVQYAVSKLKKEGILTVQTQTGPHFTNLYCLYPVVQPLHRGVQLENRELHQGGANNGMGGVQNTVPYFAPDPSGTVIDPSLNRQEPLFDQFWTAYPRKVAKPVARKAFQKAIKLCPLETMLVALKAQSKTKQWQADDGQFIPHPATWLRGNRWEDTKTEVKPQGHINCITGQWEAL